MQHRRPLLILVTIIISLLAVKNMDLFSREAYSAAAPVVQVETVSQDKAPQIPLPTPQPESENDETETPAEPSLPTPQPMTGADQERFNEIREVLNLMATGQEALALVEQYGIAIRFEAGTGSYFNPTTNQIVVDSNHEPVRAALTLVHETTHARYRHEGSAADITADGRQEYVEIKVTEEVEAVVKSIEAKMELEAAGPDVAELRYTLEYPYRMAHEDATAVALSEHPGLDKQALESIGRSAGQQAVFAGFMDGKTWTPHTKQSYPDYYGEAWDKANVAS